MSELRRLMMAKKLGGGGRLPSGYTELEYVTSNPTLGGILNTGVKPVFTDFFQLKVYRRGAYAPFGADNFVIAYSGSDWWRVFNGGGVNTNKSPFRTWITYTYENDYFTDSDGYTLKRQGSTCQQPLYLFCRQSTTSQICDEDIAYCCIRGKIELIPALRQSDNKVGFYDLVNNVFLPPTSGTFQAGPIKQ